MSASLNVYLRADHVGQLRLDSDRRFTFVYAADWIAPPNAVPLSLQLPLQTEPFDDARARPFFANLLPESDLRRALARKLGLSEHNDFALLQAIGGECAGAVSLLPEGNAPPAEAGYRPLDDAQLNALIDELPRRPLLAGEQGIRLSLAGAQHKLPVHYDGTHISVPLGGAASSHILKPAIEPYQHSVENEYFCMRLAQHLGMNVPRVTLLRKRQTLYLIERYDRKRNTEGKIERLHQEDFCQALGIAPDQKYEKEGGPGLAACFHLLREHSTQPVQDLRAALDWVLFNVAIGNADAHAKNIALLLLQDGPRLAPFYDLLCTAVYPELSDRLAMKIGCEDRPDWLIETRWQQFAADIGIGYKLLRQRLQTLHTRLPSAARNLRTAIETEQGPCPIYPRILEVITQRCDKLARLLNAATNRNPDRPPYTD